MIGFWILVYGLAILLPILAALPMLGLYQGCRCCHKLMDRGATKCPHCQEWVSDAPVAH